MVLLYGSNRDRAEVVAGPAGLALKVLDGSSGERTYVVGADPVEVGTMALLVMGRAVDLRGKSWMWTGKEAQMEDGEKVVLRAHWFVAPRSLKLPEDATSLEVEDLRKLLDALVRQATRRPIFAFTLEPVLAEGTRHTFQLSYYDLMALYRMSHAAARTRLLEEGVRIIEGLRVLARQEGDGRARLGLSAGSSTIEWLSGEQETNLRGVFARALGFQRPANFTLGALKAYVGASRLRKVRASGGDFWDVGVSVEVAGRRVTFRSPESIAALLVILGL